MSDQTGVDATNTADTNNATCGPASNVVISTKRTRDGYDLVCHPEHGHPDHHGLAGSHTKKQRLGGDDRSDTKAESVDMGTDTDAKQTSHTTKKTSNTTGQQTLLSTVCSVDHHKTVKGLTLLTNFVTHEMGRELLHFFNAQPWSTVLSRRVQHYGYEYRYDRKSELRPTTPIPPILDDIRHRLVSLGYFSRLPEQVIVAEYLPGQGIAWHTDHTDLFGDPVASLSLGCVYSMDFRRADNHSKQAHWDLLINSMLVIKGDARYNWEHGIAKRKKDGKRQREIRISITFRIIHDKWLAAMLTRTKKSTAALASS